MQFSSNLDCMQCVDLKYNKHNSLITVAVTIPLTLSENVDNRGCTTIEIVCDGDDSTLITVSMILKNFFEIF